MHLSVVIYAFDATKNKIRTITVLTLLLQQIDQMN